MTAVPEDAYRAAWQVIMSGGTLQAALEAAAPLILAARSGEDAPGRLTDSPQTAEQGPAHTGTPPRP